MTTYRIQGDGPGGSHIANVDITVEGAVPPGGWPPPQDAEGWTVLSTTADTRTFYVSSSEGDDGTAEYNDISKPYETIGAAVTAMTSRTGYPDRVLLKRGDTWTIGYTIFPRVIEGESTTYPCVIGAYGDGARPKIEVTTDSFFACNDTATYVVFVDLDIEKVVPEDFGGGINLSATTDYVLIEGCRIVGFTYNITIQSKTTALMSGIVVRRNVIADSYSPVRKGTNGTYIARTSGLLVEENVFDHNGYDGSGNGTGHNAYLQIESENTTFRRNIVARGRVNGLHFRSPGTFYENLFIGNGINAAVSYEEGYGGIIMSGRAYNNVVCEGNWRAGLNWGFQIRNVDGFTFDNNLICHSEVSPGVNEYAFVLEAGDVDGPIRNLSVKDNVVYKWVRSFVEQQNTENDHYESMDVADNDFQDYSTGGYETLMIRATNGGWTSGGNRWYVAVGSYVIDGTSYSTAQFADAMAALGDTTSRQEQVLDYPAPDLLLADYDSSIGGSGTTLSFIESAREQERGNWRSELTADVVVLWFFGNFGMTLA